MQMPLKRASLAEKLLHGGTIAAILGALFPFFQTIWTEKPWWYESKSADAPVEAPADVPVETDAEALGPVALSPVAMGPDTEGPVVVMGDDGELVIEMPEGFNWDDLETAAGSPTSAPMMADVDDSMPASSAPPEAAEFPVLSLVLAGVAGLTTILGGVMTWRRHRREREEIATSSEVA